jgi:hypothetical protein
MLEVPLDSHVFHLDATLPKRFSKDEFVSRYVDTDLAAILEFIKDTNPINARIFIQTVYDEGRPYALNEVSTVWAATDSTGQAVFICRGKENETLIAKTIPHGILGAMKKVWPRKTHAAWPSPN